MISVSDNTAANLLIDRLGMDAVNGGFRELGLSGTVLGRKMLDFEAKKAGKDNFTTAGDMAVVLETLHSGKIFSASARSRMMEILSLQKLNSKLPGLIPSSTWMMWSGSSPTRQGNFRETSMTRAYFSSGAENPW